MLIYVTDDATMITYEEDLSGKVFLKNFGEMEEFAVSGAALREFMQMWLEEVKELREVKGYRCVGDSEGECKEEAVWFPRGFLEGGKWHGEAWCERHRPRHKTSLEEISNE